MAKSFPAGYRYAYAYDTTDFIKLSIEEVVKTLIEAIILVIIVMFVFLQSWRATLVPAIAIPVVLLGTFAVLYALDFSINTLTLFGLVLAIGLLVDDAIVVVENVERLHGGKSRADAPRSDDHVDEPDPDGADRHRADPVGGVPADGLLRRIDRGHLPPILGHDRLGDGAVGPRRDDPEPGDRRPACCGETPRRSDGNRHSARRFPRGRRAACEGPRPLQLRLQRGCATGTSASVTFVVDRKWRFLGGYAAGLRRARRACSSGLPTGFLPTEDQGAVQVQFRLPAGATLERTKEVQLAVEDYLMNGPDKENVKTYFIVAGGGRGATGPEYRPGVHQPRATATIARARRIAPTRSSSARRGAFGDFATRRSSR